MTNISHETMLGLIIATGIVLPILIAALVYWSIIFYKEKRELKIRETKFTGRYFKLFILYLLILFTLADFLIFIVFISTYFK
ncbi:hypothetical protein [Williamsoniiplasma luminosum]|uniref:Uncharacterized protein n=1 Tax=Williamsoniiplasma luminosum TaxID=214888 RepID=A0A2S0NJY3_9MOLU|nr:hypothetical protein [Williamsoniiplasma luminosum]AVP49325.1 MAG: hypothetical protein C5T88_01885 [Williamsoniiplasma luminosum]